MQTAVVVGPAGEEIFPDKYGRVKVQFHWDREGSDDVNSSCWVRVATYWAGTQWGAVHIPRIGQEVIVDYVEGDVNHPIIVGSVYNADMMPPYPLPGKKTVSTVKSRSTKGGAKDNYNEFRFEDLKGKEQVFLQAERDKDVRVKAESRTWIGGNRHRIVKKSQKERVDQDKHSSVGGNYVFETGGNKHIKTNGSVYEKISGNHESTLDGNSIEKTSGSNDVTVSGDHIGKVAGKMSLTVGGSLEQKSGTKFAHEAGQEIHLKAGMKVVIEAGMQLTLKGPGGFVDIGPAGVTIQGTMVLINSGGAAGSGSGSSPGSPAIPKAPQAPEEPDAADDGTNFDKM
jgi:type VI secretion system secreted protein VgrG